MAISRDAAARIARLRGEANIPGVAAVVVDGGQGVLAACEGIADQALANPVTLRTMFALASITKLFTAVAVMQQVERGRVGLDEPVNRYLRAFRVEPPTADAPPVTARHLLTHTAGIGELPSWRAVFRPAAGLAVRPGRRRPPLAELYGPVLRTEVPAGTKWAYANHGFAVLGQIVEDVDGRSLRDYLVAEVFDPLGMERTDLDAGERLGDDVAVGYRARHTDRPVPAFDITIPAAGGSWSNVDDLSRFVAALVGGGANEHGRILLPETIGSMFEPHFRLDVRLPARGLAFQLDVLSGHRIAGHDGGNPGVSTALLVAPDDAVGAVVLANCSSIRRGLAVHRTARDLVRDALDAADPVLDVEASATSVDAATRADVSGLYRAEPGSLTSLRSWLFGGEVDVREHGDTLVLRAPWGPYGRGVVLHPDARDPRLFRTVLECTPVTIAFQGDAGRAGGLCLLDAMGQTRLRRRPRATSVVRIPYGLGAAAGILAWSEVARRRRTGTGRRTRGRR